MANLHIMLNETLKKEAKKIAKDKNLSLGEVIEDLLFKFVQQERNDSIDPEVSAHAGLLKDGLKDREKAREKSLKAKYNL